MLGGPLQNYKTLCKVDIDYPMRDLKKQPNELVGFFVDRIGFVTCQ
jgi:hypothetical protein